MKLMKDYSLPFQDMTNLVPKNLRNPMITSLIDNLFNRFLTKDEAVPLYGYVGRKPSAPDDRTPKVPQSNPERDVNALVPVFSFKVGNETYSFTAQDLIRKAEVLGISEDQSSWLYSQGNNYAPPINFDRFTNFFNYYWVAKSLPNTPALAWNPSLAPEYYTISAPKATDLDKLNVVAGTTRAIVLTGTGFYAQSWVVAFSDSTHFTVTASGAGLAPDEIVQSYTLPTIVAEQSSTYTVNFMASGAGEALLTFKIIRDPIYDGDGVWIGNESFAAGDSFTIAAPFLSSTYGVTPNVGPGVKGKINAVDSLDLYQVIDGVQIKENDRILVKNQGASVDNGIYVVKPGAFVRAADYPSTTDGARVFDRNRETLYVAQASGIWVADGSTSVSNTNDWQESNFWMHRDEATAAGLDLSKIIQATRPIIEYNSNLKLNTRFFIENSGIVGRMAAPTQPHAEAVGTPTDVGGTEYEQQKTDFNQAPQFDLYRYDGSHASLVSPIFFYMEDPTADIDPALQRRVAHASNASSDFLFGHGLIEEGNNLLFYKTIDGALHSIWHPGHSSAEITSQSFTGDGNGLFDVQVIDPFSAQQIWTLEATSATTFSVTGSKMKSLPDNLSTIGVNTPYSNGLFSAMILSGSIPFKTGDKFQFAVGNFESARYVYRDTDEQIYDLFEGANGDAAGIGAWQIPRMLYNNVAADNGDAIPEGTLYSHFRGILVNQIGQTQDNAFGGSIKLWSEQQNLLAALLMQRDNTPLSIVDFAQRKYESALNSVVDLYLKELVQFFGNEGVLTSPSKLADYLLSVRAKDNDVRTVLFDSTSPVIGFPATLPMLGVTPLVKPGVVFDNELGTELFRHHDGHLSPIYRFTQEFRDRMLSPGMLIKRADGTFTPAVGSFTTVPPTAPHRGELWIYPAANGNELRAFNVLSDGMIAPVASAVGQHWYNRATNELNVWDGALWQPESNLLAPWVALDPAILLNGVLLEVENRLYTGINAQHRTYFNEQEVQTALTGPLKDELQRELASWAAANKYDPTAPNYVSTDAFTWNYSSLGMPARWFDALKAHQASIAGVIPTSRPNLEPWKLLGFAVKPTDWNTLYKANVTQAMVQNPSLGYIGVTAKAVLWSEAPTGTPLNGLPTVDGKNLLNGDVLLLASEAAASNNGLWIVSSGAWSRAATPLVAKTVVTIGTGQQFSGTQWVLMQDVNSPFEDVLFEQVRSWKLSMWNDIKAARPGLKLSVNTVNDALLSPYVNASSPQAANALTNSLPLSPADPYLFGEGSPVETVWLRSIEFRYALTRALFRKDPMAWLGHCWGFEWVEVDGILYDGFDIAVPGHPRFRLQGDAIRSVARKTPFTMSSLSGPKAIDLTIKHSGYAEGRKFSFTVRAKDGTVIGYVNEGELGTITGAGYTLNDVLIEDEGKPFRIGDTFNITANADGSGLLVTFDQASYAQFHGFGQIFTQALRGSSVDTAQGYAIQAYRGWDVNLGYRAGGLVSTDDLRVFTDVDAIPESAYELRFKRSPFARDIWVQGLRITVVQLGSALPENTTPAGRVPSNAGQDWIFRVEGYNPRFLGIEYFTFTSGDEVTFKALSSAHTDRTWTQPTKIAGTTSTQLPLTITGLQNVVDFLFGYSQKLEADGWRFQDEEGGNTDKATGRIRNWQLEIEKFVDAVYTGIQLNQGHVLVPFMDKLWVEQDVGLLSQYFDTALFDVRANPGVFDVLGAKMNTDDLTILRSRGKSMISAKVPMFSVHAQVDEYEHLFVFSNLMSPSTGEGLIYDPFSGARIVTIKLNGRRQGSNSLRPEFGGHYLVGNEVKRNLQSSADKIAQYYDPDHAFEDELSTRHALALLGFTPKQYMADLDLTDRSQFNFWRGLIQMKGTNASIDAFLNNDRFQDAKLDEYWAYKVAEYGDSRSKIFPELRLSVDDTLTQFTKLIFDPVSIPTDFNAFTVIDSTDENRWFSIDDLNTDVHFNAQVVGTFTKVVQAGDLIKLPFIADELTTAGIAADRVNMTTLIASEDGEITVTGYGPATPKFNPVKLFNYVAAELIEEIPVWHPAYDQHTPVALESVNIISTLDPARYNVSTQVVGNNNYDPLHMWGAKEVGRVWWDTTNLDYVPYYDTMIFQTVDERLSRWGTMTDFATMDVVEWVESNVPPAEYNAQALIDAGNADLDVRTKADGQVYGAKTYSRERVWNTRAIAWSKAGVAIEAAHPSFNSSFQSNLTFTNDGLIMLESGTFAQYGITGGMRVGAWQEDETVLRPLSEYNVIGEFTKFVSYEGDLFTPVVHSLDTLQAVVDLSVLEHTEAVGELLFTAEPVVESLVPASNGAQTVYTHLQAVPASTWTIVHDMGSTAVQVSLYDGMNQVVLPDEITVVDLNTVIVTFSSNTDGHAIVLTGSTGSDWDVSTYLRVMEVDSGQTDHILIRKDRGVDPSNADSPLHFATFDAVAGEQYTFEVPSFGLQITVKVLNSGTFPSDLLVRLIAEALAGSVKLNDAAKVELVVPMVENDLVMDGSTLSNDPTDPLYTLNNGVGWRAWAVPTQAQLDADARVPNSSWFPYVGPWYAFPSAPVNIVQDAASTTPYMLNDGTQIDRYKTTWAAWSELKSTMTHEVATSTGQMVFTLPAGVTNDRVSVYVNGVSQLSGTYKLVGRTLTVLSVQSGSEVVLIVRAVNPSAADLAFDPAIADNLLIQRQYKLDYQYVAVPIRNENGQISTTKYYFWVKNRSTAAHGKNLSVKAVSQLLINGPSNYLTFQHISNSAPFFYDAITISGLSYIVTKDDAFKLRFTRNFTLRDDPNQLDLKNTHVEWSLIRPGQRTKVPEVLWQKMVNTACGKDSAGSTIPSARRVSYDERNGTRTQFGFGSDQVLAPTEMVRGTLLFTILNTKLVDDSGQIPIPDYMNFLDFNGSDTWFETVESTRGTLTRIWNEGKVSQINELFFAVLEDICAANYEMTDVFKTSRLSAYSIKVVRPSPIAPAYE